MVRKNSITISLFVFLISCCNYILPTTLIVEWDRFLIDKNAKKEFWEVGPSNFFGFYNPATIKENYFRHLDLVVSQRGEAPLIICDDCVLPQLIYDWLTNKKSAQEVKNIALQGLKNLAKNYGKKTKISQAIAKYVFSPEIYVKAIEVQKKGKELLKKCYEKRNASGQKANKIYLMTNCNAETFVLLCNNPEIKEILSYFDGVIYSGETHIAKPNPAYFECTFDKFGIDCNKESVVYLDYEITNIRAIQKLNKRNLNCIHCRDLNFRHVEQELRRFNLI